MNHLTTILTCAAILVAGVIGITLSVPLQAPAVLLLGLAAVFAAISVLQSGSKTCGEPTEQKARCFWLLGLSLISIVYFVTRAYLSPVRDLGIEDLMLIIPACSLYLIAGYALTGKDGIKIRQVLAITVILLLALHVLYCLFQFNGVEGYSLARYFEGSTRSSTMQVTGMYGYYGSFANFAVIAGLLCMSLGVWGRLTFAARGAVFLLGMAALGLAIWSQSRSAVLSLCPALIVFILMLLVSCKQQGENAQRWVKRAGFVLGIIMLCAATLGGFWVFGERGVKSFAMIFDSGVRTPLWAMAGDQWVDYPWIGAGSRSFSYLCNTYWHGLNSGELNPEFVHNEYLQLLTDYGFIGFLLITTLLISHLVLGLQQVSRLSEKVGENGLRRGSNAMALAIAGSCGMVAMAVHICFDFPTRLMPNLLLMICCAVWILPLPSLRSTRSVKDLVSEPQRSSMCRAIVLMLLVLGLGAIGLGGQQLWAGLPLIKNKIAKEDGAWKPELVDRDMWIPVLKESLKRAPHWTRYQRLGTLYYIEARESESPEQKEHFLGLSKKCYLASIERHPHNLISKINLADIYNEQKQWHKAEGLYTEMSEYARARERRFRVHKKWGDMHLRWASDLMEKQASNEVEIHFAEAKRLYNASYDYALYYDVDKWVMQYTRLLIGYANFLGHENRYEEAQTLYDEARQQGMSRNMQIHTKLNFYYAKHLYVQGNYLWHQRMPEKACDLMIKAKEALNKHQELMNGEAGEMWNRQMREVQEMIHFFEETGISREAKSLGQ
jgi:O-antigen ligase